MNSTNKKRPFNEGLLKISKRKNYFLSVWIANLGVVPLFLFSAFLLAPIFFFLFALLFSVTLVLETIYSLLKIAKKSTSTLKAYFSLSLPEKSSPLFLLRRAFSVKGFKHLLVSTLIISNSYAKTLQTDASQDKRSIVLSKGEHREIPALGLKSFSIGNPEVLSHHYEENAQNFLLKAKALGRSEVLMWFVDGSKKTYEVEIVSKEQQRKSHQLSKKLSEIGLKIENNIITGEIIDFKNYLNFISIKKQHKNNSWIINGEISSSLQKEILEKAYLSFFNHYIDDFHCEIRTLQVFCFYPSGYDINKELENYLINELGIQLIKTSGQLKRKNYRLKLKLIQYETSNGKDIGLGLDKINVALADVINKGIISLVGDNKINIGEQEIYLSTLAEPETIIHFGGKATIQVGGEIPYNSSTQLANNLSLTDWKFAGLSLKLAHSFESGLHYIKYETEFTRPTGDGGISGSKESSQLIIHEGHSQRIFQIGYQTFGNSTQRLPYLSSIPMLGQLFKSRSEQNTYKYITGFLIFSEVE